MVNFKKLADRAQKVRTVVDKQIEQQGGTDALKEKAQRMKTAAGGPGSVSDKAKAAAQVAREKPNPASDVAGDDVGGGPIGGGDAPPKVAEPVPVPAPVPSPSAAPEATEAADEPKPDPAAPTNAGSEDPSAR